MAEVGRSDSRRQITAAMLWEVLNYDPETGEFHWVARRHNVPAGKKAGGLSRGRHRIRVFGRLCEASNLAWVMMTGEWPSIDVDHRDRDASNTKWENLRLATRSQNCMNQTARRTSTSGFKGVARHCDGWWRAEISAPRVRYRLGIFREKEHAAAVYRIAAAAIHGEFSGV